ncbi:MULTISPECIES: hypothetical protein [Chitinophagaceae]
MNDITTSILTNVVAKACFVIAFLFFTATGLNAQRELGDCTINYTVNYRGKDSVMVNALKTVYIHGALVRTDFSYAKANYLQTIIQNNTSGVVNILKEVGDNKYKTVLDSVDWRRKNSMYLNSKTTLEVTDVTIILGYRCGKAMLTLENGNQYNAYYTLDVVSSNKENKYQFKDIPGIVLRYESVDESNAEPLRINAKNINLMPVSDHLFAIPMKGYRIVNDF